MSRLTLITADRPLHDVPAHAGAHRRLTLGNPPAGAPPCDRCPDSRASVELERDSGRVSAYCVPCLVELVGLGAGLQWRE